MSVTYNRSEALDPDVVAQYGCFTTLPVRISKPKSLFDEWSHETYMEWQEKVGPAKDNSGCFDPLGNMLSLSFPEAWEDRARVVTRIYECGLLHDDLVDTLPPAQAKLMNEDWADESVTYQRTQKMADQLRAKKQMESKMMIDLLNIDREHGLLILKLGKESLEVRDPSTAPTSFKTFDEWRKHRYVHACTRPALELACFSWGVKVSQSEKDSVAHIIYPLTEIGGLANDYYSFDKEYASYMRQGGSEGIPNSVWILMQEHGITAEQAKIRLAKVITSVENDYHRIRHELEQSRQKLPEHVWRYMDTAVWVTSGTFYWSSFGGRYNRNMSVPTESGRNWITTPQIEEFNINFLDQGKEDVSKFYGPISCSSDVVVVETPDSSEAQMEIFTTLSPLPIWKYVIMAPYEYITSLPSKGIRNRAIEAFNVWFEVSEEKLTVIKSIIGLLHNSSLMLDDIEDNSNLRRGKPATHIVFGEAQTINSANYLFVLALEETQKLSPSAISIYASEIKNLHEGQSMDLHWTHTVNCPSQKQYCAMVDQKTGGLFRLLGRLMESESSSRTALAGRFGIEGFTTLLGRYFQIRDDYQNLCSPDYASQKGFCEDLDEGKFSLPLIHTREHTKDKILLQALLLKRKQQGKMTLAAKRLVLDQMNRYGSLEYTRRVAKGLEENIELELQRIEELTGKTNWILRLLMEGLKL